MKKFLRNVPAWVWATVLMVGFAALLVSGHVLHSYMEAAAYNRVTGDNVSTWDAIWVELRVQAEPKR